jgi:hypothetical protein
MFVLSSFFNLTSKAIRRANSTVYGLGAGICTRDSARVCHHLTHVTDIPGYPRGIGCSRWNRLHQLLQSVCVILAHVDPPDVFDVAAPFGGFKVGLSIAQRQLTIHRTLASVVSWVSMDSPTTPR